MGGYELKSSIFSYNSLFIIYLKDDFNFEYKPAGNRTRFSVTTVELQDHIHFWNSEVFGHIKGWCPFPANTSNNINHHIDKHVLVLYVFVRETGYEPEATSEQRYGR